MHALESKAEFDGVRPAGEEGVVVKLDGIPGVVEFVEAAETKRCGDARNGNLGRADGARGNRKSQIRGNSIAGNGGVDVANHAAESCADGIYERRVEDVSVFGADHLTSGKHLVNGVAERIGLRLWAGIEKVATGKIIFAGESMVDSGNDVVFAGVIRGG